MAGNLIEFIFRADNRSTIRALNQIAEQSEKTHRTIRRDADANAASFRRMGESAGRLRGVIGGLAGTVGLGGLALGLKDVISAGEAWQAQQTQLQGALKATGAGVANLTRLQKVAEDLSTHGGFGTTENLQALTQFVSATHSATKAQSDLTLATNISRRSGKDFTTVVRAIMMLENGRTTGLARLGIAIPKVTTAQQALHAEYKKITPSMLAAAKAQDALASKQQAFASLESTYAGATGRFSNTTAGRVSNLRNTWRNLQEQLGAGLLPIVNRVIGALAGLVGWLNRHREVLYVFLGSVAAVTGILAAHALAMEILRAKTYFVSGVQTLLGRKSEETAGRMGQLGAVVADRSVPALSGLAGAATRAAEALALFAEKTGIGGTVALAEGGASAGLLAAGGGKVASRFGLKGLAGIAGKVLGKAGPWMLGASVLATIANHTGLSKILPSPLRSAASFLGFANGGTTPYSGTFMVGERGPELVHLPGGSYVQPNDQLGGMFVTAPIVLKIDGRVLAQTVVRQALNKAARGPSNMTGGSLVTGAPGLPL